MSLRFSYQPKPMKGRPGVPHPSGVTNFWRPLIPIRIMGQATARRFPEALVDPGSVDTIFPWSVARSIGVVFLPDSGFVVRWRGTAYPIRFGDVEMELHGHGQTWRWTARVGFTQAELPYVILGHFGFLQYLDVTFHGYDQVVELEGNASYPGTIS